MKYVSAYLMSTLFILVSVPTWAGSVTLPNTFSSGTKAKASQVNANFDAVKKSVDNNDTRVTDLESLWVPLGVDLHAGVTGSVFANNFAYSTQKTRYLQLAGGACTHPEDYTGGYYKNSFMCELSNTTGPTIGYWNVNIPNGAVLRGMQAYVYTDTGSTITCYLQYGVQRLGTTIATLSDNIENKWHMTQETALRHVVDTATNAYVVKCTVNNSGSNVIGSIRLRYTVSGPG